MREMTTAEFAKANLAALEEPISVRRYTKTIGTYYPEGYEPFGPPPTQQLALDAVASVETSLTQASRKVQELEEEVKRLKQELSRARMPSYSLDEAAHAVSGPVVAVGKTYGAQKSPREDAFEGLAAQDREFFERKLGKSPKKG